MKTAILSFVYPQALPYLPDFFESCLKQSDPDFEVLLVLDGVKLPTPPRQLKVEAQLGRGTIAEIRAQGIRFAETKKIEALLLADSDDWFDQDRVKITKKLLKTAPIICNQLQLATGPQHLEKVLWKTRLKDGQTISQKLIEDKNCLGFSNTAIRLFDLQQNLPSIPREIVAFDWLFFTSLLESGYEASYTTEFSTFYRQYEGNVASLLNIDKKVILRGLEIKLQHYHCLENPLASSFDQILKRVRSDSAYADRYCAKMISNIPADPMWWEATQILGD